MFLCVGVGDREKGDGSGFWVANAVFWRILSFDLTDHLLPAGLLAGERDDRGEMHVACETIFVFDGDGRRLRDM